jgi:hypothetical protein
MRAGLTRTFARARSAEYLAIDIAFSPACLPGRNDTPRQAAPRMDDEQQVAVDAADGIMQNPTTIIK